MISYSRAALMREQSNPKVFFVYGGFKLWIQTPDALFALGFDWSKVQVVADGTLAALPEKPFDTTAPVKASDVFFQAAPGDTSSDPFFPMMSKDPAFIVRKNIIVAGWLADPEGPGPLGALNCWGAPDDPFVAEDYHYDVIMDVDFMYQLYGPGGLSTALNGAVLPGNLSGPPPAGSARPTMNFDDKTVDGTVLGVTSNSFALPHMAGGINHSGSRALGFEDPLPDNYRSAGPLFIHGELNCWHVNGGPFGRRPYTGRGPAPSGWVQWAVCKEANNDAFWPYPPLNPDNGPTSFKTGDYVLMKGAVVQEHAHDLPTPSAWRGEVSSLMHCGVIEMHPPDWMVRVQEPPIRKTAFMVACCTARTVGDSPADVPFEATAYPYPYLQSPPGPNAVFHWRKLIDGRFSHAGTFQEEVVLGPGENTNIPGKLGIQGWLHSTTVQGRYKASYEIWWEMPLMASCFPNHVTIGSNVTIRVHAEDSSTHAAVAGTVKAGGVVIGSSDTDIQHAFEVSQLPLTFSAPNYSDIQVQLAYQPGLLHVTTTPIIFNRVAPVTVSATNAAGAAVTNGDVLINGVKVGVLGQPFNYKFVSTSPPGGGPLPAKPVGGVHPSKDALAGGPHTGASVTLPAGTVIAPGYVNAAIPWNVSDAL